MLKPHFMGSLRPDENDIKAQSYEGCLPTVALPLLPLLSQFHQIQRRTMPSSLRNQPRCPNPQVCIFPLHF